MSQRELAEKAKVTQATICNLEKGGRQIQYKTAIALANALGLELSELGYERKPEDTVTDKKDSIIAFFEMLNSRQKKLTADIEEYNKRIEATKNEVEEIEKMKKSIKHLIKNSGGFDKDEL